MSVSLSTQLEYRRPLGLLERVGNPVGTSMHFRFLPHHSRRRARGRTKHSIDRPLANAVVFSVTQRGVASFRRN